MASEVLNELSSQYRLLSAQLENAVKQEFRPWSVVRNTREGQHGLFISIGVLKHWIHVRVNSIVSEWKIEDTVLAANQSEWPDWIKKAKGVTDE